MKTDHILIMRFSAMGDVAMLVPVVYSLATQYPALRITVLSRPFARPFFENLRPNVGFMEADVNKEYKGISGLNALYRRLLAKNFTAVADMHNVLRTNYLRMRFNVSQFRVAHINKRRVEKHRLIRNTAKVFRPLPSSFHNYADVLDELGYPIHLEFTSIFPPSGGNLRLLEGRVSDKKLFQQWIGVAPFAAHPGKIYPIELMKKVIAQLAKNHPSCRIFLFGGGQRERKLLDEIAADHQQCINASAILNGLSEELILMSHLDVMISMDSANMHLASVVGTSVVSIWGATHPYGGFMGWNQSRDHAVQVSLPCRPCSIYGNKKCERGDLACLYQIKPEQIIEKVEAVLRTPKTSTAAEA